jgi:hypothetical protein
MPTTKTIQKPMLDFLKQDSAKDQKPKAAPKVEPKKVAAQPELINKVEPKKAAPPIKIIKNLDELKISDDDDWDLSEFDVDGPVRNIYPLKNQTESVPKKVQESQVKVVDSKLGGTPKKEPDRSPVGL